MATVKVSEPESVEDGLRPLQIKLLTRERVFKIAAGIDEAIIAIESN